ncbi:diguanylate cyclase domain-containing protein [Thiospirillum jenense]|uniref:Diguanylate cyclase n=1 Tax=Thiospirillum jenense TaxID=1653858 RepID=A0A839H9B3_9GAMM|nr:diguanylate cyclase [Thiospirillum jenense]MBB1125631.1 diguanylate cyclase [Thiospirillum jenense]
MIVDYQILSKMYESANSEVYRAIRDSDKQKVILKFLKQDYPAAAELARYKQEYKLTSSLKLKGVIKAYGLKKYQRTLVMFIEDFDGESLNKLHTDCPLALDDFLPLAINIASILGRIHHANIIHKDINPANIVNNPATRELKIIDFGISTRLTRENPTLKNPNVLEGTLSYISPEQTGRMNRSLDYRTDLYSLGVTFYELLVGQLPFITEDDLELIHCHIARQPINPTEIQSYIPQIVSDIILKLMAKNAEDRYQSAWGLQTDLERCLKQLQTTSSIQPFTLATADISDKFQLVQKLYGREAEIQTLLDTFHLVTGDSAQMRMILVAGYSGIGKSALVRELYKPITEKRGYFITGKFDQFQRNVPYSAIVQALSELVKAVLTERVTQLSQWRNRLLSALGANGQVVVDLIPELELIIGQQPPVPELGANESQNRFNFVFQNFIKVFAQPQHPLTLFIDDLQWADGASLKLIQLLMSGEAQALFLIGAYRDNEVSAAHPLMLTLDEITHSGAIIDYIFLKPLQLTTIKQLISDSLKTTPEHACSLAELVQLKTGGNPFFLNEFLKSLYAEALLRFDRHRLQWSWNLADIQQRNFTDNVVELMTGKIQRLPMSTQAILKIAAAVGNQFSIPLLSAFEATTLRDVIDCLDIAVSENLVIPLDTRENIELALLDSQNYPLPPYKFVHDRIQQAAYSQIPELQKPATHYQLGRILLQQLTPSEREEYIFSIINQLNQGLSLINEPLEKNEIIQLNIEACLKAKASAAYYAAREYATVGLALLGNEIWKNYTTSLVLHELQAELAFLCGDFVEMDHFIDAVIDNAESALDMVKVYIIRIQANAARNKISEALAVGQEILQRFDIQFPTTPTIDDVEKALHQNTILLTDRHIHELVKLPEMTNPSMLAVIEIGNRIMPAAFNAGSLLFHLIGSLTVKLSIQYGNAPSSCFSYSTYGTILCKLTQDIVSAIQFGQLALDVLYKYNALPVKASVLTVFALFIKHRNAHLHETIPILKEAYTTALDTGDFEYSGYSAYGHCIASLWSGQPLAKVHQDTTAYVNDLSKRGQLTTANYCRIYLQTIDNLLGHNQQPTSFIGDVVNGDVLLPHLLSLKDVVGVYFFYLYNMVLCLLFDDTTQARAHALIGRQYVMSGAALFTQSLFYFYDSLIALMGITSADEALDSIMQRVTDNQIIISHNWSTHAPMNHQHKLDLVEAERYRVLGNISLAMDYYDRAIAGAQQHEFIQDAALAYELAAKFYLAQNRILIAKTYLREARYYYELWGSNAKIAHLNTHYPNELLVSSKHVSSRGSSTSHNTVSALAASATFDMMTIIKANQSISEEVVLEKLLKNLLNILLENTGAEMGCLLFYKQELEIGLHSHGVTTIAGHFPESILNYVVRTKELVLLDDASAPSKFDKDSYIQTKQPLSILCYPLINQGQLTAIIYLENNMSAAAFTQDRVDLIKLLSGQASIAITNAVLYREREQYTAMLEEKVKERTAELEAANDALSRLANLDGLTKIPNRRCFDHTLLQEWQRHLHAQQMLALILIDIDYFKKFNDHYGHQGGDDCLIQVAQTIATTLQRSTDFAGRYGGEEFVIILPNTAVEGALFIANSIREAILKQAIPHQRSEVHQFVTLSLGVAAVIPNNDLTPDCLIALADKALYTAKDQGRNRAIGTHINK